MLRLPIISIALVFCLAHCQNKPERKAGVQLLKGRKQFRAEFEKLGPLLGVVPLDTSPFSDDIVKKDPASWNEFFLSDKFTSLIILSVEPRYFLKIDSADLYHHLRREYLQIKDGLTASANKVMSSNPFLKKVGDYRVEVYFTPKELRHNTSCRIAQVSEHKPRPDIWRLTNASKKSIFFTPEFQEMKLLMDFTDSVTTNKTKGWERAIYTNDNRSGDDSSLIMPTDLLFNFSFIWGEGLEPTDELLDGQSKYSGNIYELTSNFIAFFSLSLGNPLTSTGECTSASRKASGLNTKDGIMVLVRGDLKWLEKFLRQEGFSFEL